MANDIFIEDSIDNGESWMVKDSVTVTAPGTYDLLLPRPIRDYCRLRWTLTSGGSATFAVVDWQDRQTY